MVVGTTTMALQETRMVCGGSVGSRDNYHGLTGKKHSFWWRWWWKIQLQWHHRTVACFVEVVVVIGATAMAL